MIAVTCQPVTVSVTEERVRSGFLGLLYGAERREEKEFFRFALSFLFSRVCSELVSTALPIFFNVGSQSQDNKTKKHENNQPDVRVVTCQTFCCCCCCCRFMINCMVSVLLVLYLLQCTTILSTFSFIDIGTCHAHDDTRLVFLEFCHTLRTDIYSVKEVKEFIYCHIENTVICNDGREQRQVKRGRGTNKEWICHW